MEKIASFQVNHLTLVPGVYVSRRDKVGSETLTTFDLRMTRPNNGRIASFISDRWDAELDFI